MLLKCGVDTNLVNDQGQTVLNYVTMMKNYQIKDLLQSKWKQKRELEKVQIPEFDFLEELTEPEKAEINQELEKRRKIREENSMKEERDCAIF